jgi:hypothetical protein
MDRLLAMQVYTKVVEPRCRLRQGHTRAERNDLLKTGCGTPCASRFGGLLPRTNVSIPGRELPLKFRLPAGRV